MMMSRGTRKELEPDTPSQEDIQLSDSYLLRGLLVAAGSFFLALGFLGVFLPILPTTPFLLLTAACYARGSKKFYTWLLTNRLFGGYIREWREHRSLPLRSKVVILILLWGTILMTSLFALSSPIGKVAIFLVPIGVSLLIFRIPTRGVADQTSSV